MSSNSDQELVCGLNTVNQIIISRPKSVQSLYVGEAQNKRIKSVLDEAEINKIKIIKKDPEFFEKEFKDINHQSIAVTCNKRLEESEAFIQSIIERPNLTFLILDGLSDPHNVGACLRSAAAVDVDAVIVPKNRSCHLTPSVRKISCTTKCESFASALRTCSRSGSDMAGFSPKIYIPEICPSCTASIISVTVSPRSEEKSAEFQTAVKALRTPSSVTV